MKKPAIPQAPREGQARGQFDQSLKESLEVIMGRRGAKLTPLPETATVAEVAAKLNEIIAVLQG